METKAVDGLKRLCVQLGEEKLIPTIDSFVQLNKEIESKKGREFTELSILSFIEGILIILKQKYPRERKVVELLNEVQHQRMQLEIKFRKPRTPYIER